MNEDMKQRIDLLVENKQMAEREFAWNAGSMCTAVALSYTEKNEKVDIERLKKANEFLKANVRMFSNFKGHAKLALLVQLAGTDSMEDYFARVQEIYRDLSGDKLIGIPEYYIIAAMVIMQRDNNLELTDVQCVQKTKSIYKSIKDNHPWLTGEQNLGFAALLAVSGLEENAIMEEMESCYNYLKEEKKIGTSGGMQSLAQVLSLTAGDSHNKCDKTADIFNELRTLKKKYGMTNELSTLGALSFTEIDPHTLAKEIAEADDYLRTKKGFGLLMGSKERLMYASILVMQQHSVSGDSMNTSALTSIIAQVIAEEIVMMIIMMSCMTTMAVSSAH